MAPTHNIHSRLSIADNIFGSLTIIWESDNTLSMMGLTEEYNI